MDLQNKQNQILYQPDQPHPSGTPRKTRVIILFSLAIILLLASLGIFVGSKVVQNITTKELPKPVSPTPIAVSPSPAHTDIIVPSIQPTTIVIPTKKITPPVTAAPQQSAIQIKGDEDCVTRTQEALTLLQNGAPVHYQMAEKYVGVIECAEQGSGMFAWESPPRFQVGKATYQHSAMWYAGTIVHDAWHSKLYHDYLTNTGSPTAPDSEWTGRDAEQKCLDVQYDALAQLGASPETLEHVKNSINTNYWDVPFDQRNW